ncbi:MAG: translation initiation factor IF-2 subunit beta [Candidatus Altiarchaeales archaeon]|nr:translation initiation factor IF-2 subunit beta [Candidatus Altiarchaeota archaeon]MBU4341066.1 translation initiation factor IF-2 subunit beta [Candidatus Altiarchaeota archaeon]MBU4406159.1 translation initiation factor IF-2 subunit beta [Candidatus Altiarchaeota archaeon]MBU4437513.1 translation initiation factor IF-2 subunit beta [Candidatus Altiarchaeota archaeon]MCG2782364.1 translation initiation factor IF-2 subunit beta [Candidatus Altiarchaeales archaeon]
MNYDYASLLDRAWANLPEELQDHSRFQMPEVDTLIEGNQTIITNFNEIVNALRRKPQHLLTFLSKELAAPATFDDKRAIVQRVLKKSMITKKVEDYAKIFVLCHECGRPDTKITELSGQRIIKCSACGGWWPLRKIK